MSSHKQAQQLSFLRGHRPLTGEEIVEYVNTVSPGRYHFDEDFKQYACEMLWVRQQKYNPQKSSIGTFLSYVMRHSVADYLRKYKGEGVYYTGARLRENTEVYRHTHYDTSEETIPEVIDIDAAEELEGVLAGATEDDLTLIEIKDWLSGLTKREKEVAFLYTFYGFRLQDLAERYGVTESRICQIITRLPLENLRYLPTPQTGTLALKPQQSFRFPEKPSRPIERTFFVKRLRAA